MPGTVASPSDELTLILEAMLEAGTIISSF